MRMVRSAKFFSANPERPLFCAEPLSNVKGHQIVQRCRPWLFASLLLASVVTGCSGQNSGVSTLPMSGALSSNTSAAQGQTPMVQAESGQTRSALATAQAASSYVGIDAGGAATGNWVADTDYSGGWPASVSTTINTSKVTNPAPQQVYQSQRTGTAFTYTIHSLAASAAYTVRLHLVESWWTAAGKREFNVSINGSQVLTNFDIFKTAGGENIAVVEQFSTHADSTGTITVTFTATVDNATIAGLEIESASASAASTPTPTPATGTYPVYSSYFTGNTPFHHSVASLMSAGASVLSSTIAQHYWSEGINTTQPFNSSGMDPLYFVHSGDPGYVFSCPAYGTCSVSGKVIHYPSGAAASTGSDHHLVSFDPVYADGETDGWGGDGSSNQQCNLISGSPNGNVTCSWGGFFPFSGNGLANPIYDSGIAGGYALGLISITAQELLQGHIDHALGITESCLDNNGVYPSQVGRSTDSACPSSEEPNAVYGDMIHLKSGVNVASLSTNSYCRTVLTAFQTYGAYTSDNDGSYGISLMFESPNNPLYAASNPWTTTIFPSLVSTGDASGTPNGGPLYFKTCLQNVPAGDIEVIQISSNLPG
jgi:hypothetical protein